MSQEQGGDEEHAIFDKMQNHPGAAQRAPVVKGD